jgi:hypothetical protein
MLNLWWTIGSEAGSSTSSGVSPVTFIPPMLHIHSSQTRCNRR